MGNCSAEEGSLETLENPILQSSDEKTRISPILSKFPSLFNEIKIIIGEKVEAYILVCMVGSQFNSIIFELSDCKRNVWKKEVGMIHLQKIKSVIDVKKTLKWKAFFKEFQKAFENNKISVRFKEDNSAKKRQTICYLTIYVYNLSTKKNTNLQFKLKPNDSLETEISRHFVQPLYQFYDLCMDKTPEKRLKDLTKKLDNLKAKYQNLLEIQAKREDKIKRDKMNEGEGVEGKNGSTDVMVGDMQKNDEVGNILTGEEKIREEKENKQKIIDVFAVDDNTTKEKLVDKMSIDDVAKFLKQLMKKLISSGIITAKEHESMICVIGNLTNDTYFSYSFNQKVIKKLDDEVIEYLKVKFELKVFDGDIVDKIKITDGQISKGISEFTDDIDESNINKVSTRNSIIKMFDKVDEWNFDVFILDDLTEGQTLFITCYTLFLKYDLLRKFNIPEFTLVQFLKEIEGGYASNPYHNAMHAADVTQITHYMISKGGIGDYITDVEVIAMLSASLVHDLGHPGLNNNFQVATQSYLATIYNDRSVLENHHVSQAFELLKSDQYNIFKNLSKKEYKRVRTLMIDLVIATDMGLHANLTSNFSTLIENEADFRKFINLQEALKIGIKFADISNASREPQLYLKWAQRIEQEFYKQGDEERSIDVAISPFMDRRKPSLQKLQISFISYLVIPMVESFIKIFPNMSFAYDYIKRNKKYWSYFNDADLTNLLKFEEFEKEEKRIENKRSRKGLFAEEIADI